jgi:hypothetical protein
MANGLPHGLRGGGHSDMLGGGERKVKRAAMSPHRWISALMTDMDTETTPPQHDCENLFPKTGVET